MTKIEYDGTSSMSWLRRLFVLLREFMARFQSHGKDVEPPRTVVDVAQADDSEALCLEGGESSTVQGAVRDVEERPPEGDKVRTNTSPADILDDGESSTAQRDIQGLEAPRAEIDGIETKLSSLDTDHPDLKSRLEKPPDAKSIQKISDYGRSYTEGDAATKHGGSETIQVPDHIPEDGDAELPSPQSGTQVSAPASTNIAESKGRSRHPSQRGGRPRGTGSASSRMPTVSDRDQKPELVCWRKGMNWAVGIRVPEEATDREWEIRQGSSVLEEDAQRPGHWALVRPLSQVSATMGDGECKYTYPEEPFRIFKLFGRSRDRGPYMRSLTCGRFLVIAPNDWELEMEIPAIESPIAPEYLIGMQWRAHHVYLPQRTSGFHPKLVVPDGTCVHIPVAGSAFVFEGDIIQDADTDSCPLFRGDPPQLRCLGESSYALVVIGEEGPRNEAPHWRDSATDFDELRPAIAARGSGWYFVRLYDQEYRLIESLDFRFSSKLQAVRVQADSPIPGANGHSSAFADIVHDDTVEIMPADDRPAKSLAVHRSSVGSRIEIPPSARFDHTKWLVIERGTSGVSLFVSVDRVWWFLREEQTEFSECDWTDRPVDLREEDLFATSRRVFRIRLPATWQMSEVHIGVERHRSLTPRPVAGHPNELELACRELGRFMGFDQHTIRFDLRLWIRQSETRDWSETLLARLSPPPIDIKVTPSSALRLQALKPARLMQVLTRVRRRHRRYKSIIDELRSKCYRPLRRGRRRREWHVEKRDQFLREALCLLALVVEESYAAGEKPRIPSHYARRAKLAQMHFPECFTAIKSRVSLLAPASRRFA